jgi:hypothetical protein
MSKQLEKSEYWRGKIVFEKIVKDIIINYLSIQCSSYFNVYHISVRSSLERVQKVYSYSRNVVCIFLFLFYETSIFNLIFILEIFLRSLDLLKDIHTRLTN